MKILAEEVKNNNLIEEEREALSARLNDLAIQVIALDGKSRRTEDGKILEWASMAVTIAVGADFLYK